jgi:hypothetical protein
MSKTSPGPKAPTGSGKTERGLRRPTKKQAQADRSRVNAVYGRVANGVQVPIMSLGRVMDAGLAALAAGGDDAAIALAVKAVVDPVRSVVLTDEQLAALKEVLYAALDQANENADMCRPKDMADVLGAKSVILELMEAVDRA